MEIEEQVLPVFELSEKIIDGGQCRWLLRCNQILYKIWERRVSVIYQIFEFKWVIKKTNEVFNN